MGNMAYRKSAVLSVGGFNERLQRREDEELAWRMRKTGYKVIRDASDIGVIHLEGKERFTLIGYLRRRAFWYGYWEHQLLYLHPKIVKYRGFPIKLVIFAVVLTLAFYYPISVSLPFLWFLWASYRARHKIRFCLGQCQSRVDKVLTILVISLILVLLALVADVGIIYAIIDKARGKLSKVG